MSLPVRRSERTPASRTFFDWDPFAEFDLLNRRMGDLFNRAFQPLMGDRDFVPAADVEETDTTFVVEVELPGIDRSDIDVELVGRRLRVSGERKEKERTGVLRSKSRIVGRFEYEVAFPAEVDESGVEASFTDGVLTVTVPKAETEKPRKIQVK
ncbi:MAG TPA: Hsp20/alpha crystallin family protein [Acidimicrobiia bacterium]|jgi:HSP20 family protein|nr:Hsp20/alpha crystallin family protein [Acidimicrobiia bacterium]